MGVFFFATLFIFPIFADNITTSPADCNNTVLSTADGPATLTAQYRPNTIDIAWYSDNVKITGDATAATTCTYNGTFTLPTPPTKLGYVFDGWKPATVPSGYTRLEYIESTGTQYINTGIVGKSGVSVQAKFMLNTSDNGSLFGNRMSGSTRFWPAMWYSNKWNATVAVDSYSRSTAISANTMYVTYFVSNSSGWTFDVNGTRVVSGTDTVNNTNNMWMFGTNNGSLQYPFKGKAYYAMVWENDVLVRNFIPAKNSSNVVGMYDTVSGTFFTNSGSGNFTAGPELN